MGRWVTKPKRFVMEPIPPRLLEAMIEVLRLVEDAERDPDIQLDFDDAIQLPGLCGGRDLSAKREFQFAFWPQSGTRCKWDLTLHAFEIENIADGVTTELNLYGCQSPECLCRFQSQEDKCFCCDWVEDDKTIIQLKANAENFKSKHDFICSLLALEPKASAARALSIFQPIPGLGDRVGWFSLDELESLIEELRRNLKT